MGAGAYVLLDIVSGRSEQVAKALQGKPGVMMADLLEAFERPTLAELTVRALTSVETAIKSVHLLPTQDDRMLMPPQLQIKKGRTLKVSEGVTETCFKGRGSPSWLKRILRIPNLLNHIGQ
jgi:hypothetical protein